MSTHVDPIKILDAKAADGIGTPRHVADLDHIMLALDTADSANLTVKFQGSYAKEMPDFAAAQSAANQWDYIEVKDIEDGSAIDGDTGIAMTGTDDHRMLEANVSGLTWICAIVSSLSAGSATLVLFGKKSD